MDINKVVCGDCLDVLPTIQNESIDLVLTSPPYNIGIDYGVYKDNLKWEDYLIWCKKWITECCRVLKPDGRFVINVLSDLNAKGNRQMPLVDFSNIIRDVGLNIHGVGFWIDITRSKYSQWGSWKSASCPYIYNPFEALIIGYKKIWKKKIKGKDTISKESFICGVKGTYNFGTARHKICKAVFPLKLPTLFIELLTYEGDIVLDPFGGSGTTAIACINTKRNYILIEKNKEYVEVINKRICK